MPGGVIAFCFERQGLRRQLELGHVARLQTDENTRTLRERRDLEQQTLRERRDLEQQTETREALGLTYDRSLLRITSGLLQLNAVRMIA